MGIEDSENFNLSFVASFIHPSANFVVILWTHSSFFLTERWVLYFYFLLVEAISGLTADFNFGIDNCEYPSREGNQQNNAIHKMKLCEQVVFLC